MIMLWARAIDKHRIVRSETAVLQGDLPEAIAVLLSKMDLPRPLFLQKHQREWTQFGQTTFLPDHFMESIPYEKIEIEQFDPDAKKAKSKDPRNG